MSVRCDLMNTHMFIFFGNIIYLFIIYFILILYFYFFAIGDSYSITALKAVAGLADTSLLTDNFIRFQRRATLPMVQISGMY